VSPDGPEGPVRRGHLGLGSNQGDRAGALAAARDRLDAAPGLRVVAASSAWETAPQGEVLDQPDFLNAVLAVETALDPEALLALCKGVERELGRPARARRHGPRPIDVDVLLLGDLVHSSERLVLPHPELLARRFVLEPLLELEPGLVLPDGTRAADALAGLADQRVTRAGPLPGPGAAAPTPRP
jgi:2-amino-4-hydroxy-6-hydroxymethyldihydropteridine diphosphokinase